MNTTASQFHRRVRRMRAFAGICTGNPSAADAVLLTRMMAWRDAPDPPSEVAAYRDLHRALSRLPYSRGRQRSASRDAAIKGDWACFQRLTVMQRAAVFLVIGAEFTTEEASIILDEDVDRVSTALTSGLISLQEVFPLRPSPAASRPGSQSAPKIRAARPRAREERPLAPRQHFPHLHERELFQ